MNNPLMVKYLYLDFVMLTNQGELIKKLNQDRAWTEINNDVSNNDSPELFLFPKIGSINATSTGTKTVHTFSNKHG